MRARFWWCGIALLASLAGAQRPPVARKDTVEETIHGHKIADPYRWLDDSTVPTMERTDEAAVATCGQKVKGRRSPHHMGGLRWAEPGLQNPVSRSLSVGE